MTRIRRAALSTYVAAVFFGADGTGLPPVGMAAAQAQVADAGTGDTDATALEKLSVKATNGKTGVADTPLATQTTAETINDEQISSFEDLGRSLESGVGFNRANGSVSIRGLDGPRVQTTIDGIVIPYLDDGARDADGGIDSFDFNALSTVDIVRGADSSRAGDGALGGAVVLRTLEPEDLIADGRTWGGIFKFAYDGDDRSFSPSAAIAARHDNTAVLVQGGYRKGHERDNGGTLDIFGAGRETPNPADFDQRNGLLKIKQYTDTGHTFTLTGERFNRDKDIDLRLEQSEYGNYRPGDWDGHDQVQRDRVSLNYAYEAMDDDTLLDAADAIFYWQGLTRNSGKAGARYASVIGDFSRNSELENRTFGMSGSGEKSFDTGEVRHTVRVYGDLSFGRTTQYSSGTDACSGGPYSQFDPCNFLHTNQSDMPDVDNRKLGLSIEDEMAVGDSGFSLTPGLRYDWYDQSPKDTPAYTRNPNFDGLPPGQSEDAFSPKLLAKYAVADDVEFFAQWAMAFRSPTTNELYLDYGAPGTYLVLGNPNLKPERSSGFEFGATLGDEDFGGGIRAFHNRYRNFIDTIEAAADPDYPFGVTQKVNLDRVRISGVELSAHRRFDSGFFINGSITYADGKNLDPTVEFDRLGSVAPLKGVIGGGYATDTWGTDMTLIASKPTAAKSDSTFGPIAGYGIVDLTGWWKPEAAEGLTLRAGIYNLFDKQYFDALNVRDVSFSVISPGRAYYSEPGRTLRVSLTQRF